MPSISQYNLSNIVNGAIKTNSNIFKKKNTKNTNQVKTN